MHFTKYFASLISDPVNSAIKFSSKKFKFISNVRSLNLYKRHQHLVLIVYLFLQRHPLTFLMFLVLSVIRFSTLLVRVLRVHCRFHLSHSFLQRPLYWQYTILVLIYLIFKFINLHHCIHNTFDLPCCQFYNGWLAYIPSLQLTST